MQSVVQNYDTASRKELSTKSDLYGVRTELKEDIQTLDKKISDTKHELIKWLVGAMLAQSALIVAIMAFMK